MPKIDTLDMSVNKIPGTSFTFSAVKPEKLGATEYTIVGLVVDETGSVDPFAEDLLKMEKAVVDACKKVPRSENLVLRVTHFNQSNIREIHGFKELIQLDSSTYNTITPYGCTNLFDATYEMLSACISYAEAMYDSDITSVNIALYIVTDGDDNNSRYTPLDIKKMMEKTIQNEKIESIISILVGVNANDPRMSGALKDFQTKANISSYIETDNADAKTLAKIGSLISKSVSSQSQALGSGGPSQVPQSLTF